MGILAAVFANTLIQHMGDEAWNISSGAGCSLGGVVLALLFGAMILPAVESPRWLMKMHRRDVAIAVLTKINGARCFGPAGTASSDAFSGRCWSVSSILCLPFLPTGWWTKRDARP